MQNLSRRSIKALEDATKAVRRDTAAKQKAARALLDLMREEDAQNEFESSRPETGTTRPAKKQPTQK